MIDHVTANVSDFERAKHFYEQALAGHGWKVAPFGGASPVGGFQPTRRDFCQSPSGPALTVTAYA